MGLPTATVQMLGPDGITHVATGLGTGPVDAAYKAIDSLIRVPVHPAPLTNLPGPDIRAVWSAWRTKGVPVAMAVWSVQICACGTDMRLFKAMPCCRCSTHRCLQVIGFRHPEFYHVLAQAASYYMRRALSHVVACCAQVELTEYSVSSVTEGIEALATTRIVVRPAGKMAGEGFVTSHKVRPRSCAPGQRSARRRGACSTGRAMQLWEDARVCCAGLPAQCCSSVYWRWAIMGARLQCWPHTCQQS